MLDDEQLITKNDLEALGFSLNLNLDATNEICLFAVFENARYSAYFNLPNEIYKEQEFEVGQMIVEPIAPDVVGYVFEGWFVDYTGSTGTNIENNRLYNFIRDGMPEENLFLYAGFSLQDYQLTLVIGDDATYPIGQSNKAIYTIEDDFILKPPFVEGKEFVGWTGMGIINPVIDLRIYKMTGNRTYYANYV